MQEKTLFYTDNSFSYVQIMDKRDPENCSTKSDQQGESLVVELLLLVTNLTMFFVTMH